MEGLTYTVRGRGAQQSTGELPGSAHRTAAQNIFLNCDRRHGSWTKQQGGRGYFYTQKIKRFWLHVPLSSFYRTTRSPKRFPGFFKRPWLPHLNPTVAARSSSIGC